MSASVSDECSFKEAVCYALKRLGKPDIQLREEQERAICAVYKSKGVYLWFPTGFGKSICFQMLPFLFDYKLGFVNTGKKSAVLVVVPVVALMAEQVRALRDEGVEAVIIFSAAGRGSYLKIPPDLLATESSLSTASLFFCSPEAFIEDKRDALLEPSFSERVKAIVDEAHCVSKWSESFLRPYRHLPELRSFVPPQTPFMVCTTSAARSDKIEILKNFVMRECVEVSASPNRPDVLYYKVKPRTTPESDLGHLLTSLKTSSVNAPRFIVYCQSPDMCTRLYAHFHYELGDNGYYPPGAPNLCEYRLYDMFHSYTLQHIRNVIEQSLLHPDGKLRVVFTTIALNAKNVSAIVHYGAPRSVEEYFQFSGMGGCSGERAVSTIYWKPRDCQLSRNHRLTIRDKEIVVMRKYLENTALCRRRWLLNHFDVDLREESGGEQCCDVCSGTVAHVPDESVRDKGNSDKGDSDKGDNDKGDSDEDDSDEDDSNSEDSDEF